MPPTVTVMTKTKPRKTKSSTPRLSEAARHVVYPDDIRTTGWPRIRRRLASMGVVFDPWQESASSLILGKRADGKYAATEGGVTLSIPRQVGKTFMLGSLMVAMCIEYPGLEVIWTSHHLRTTTNTFQSMQGVVTKRGVKQHLKPSRNDGIRTANGEQEIAFKNGSRIRFGARKEGFGRGLDGIDVEVFDEAQILGEKDLSNMLAAVNQARHPHGALLFYIGTPPTPHDDSEAFATRRREAIGGESQGAIYIEFSADTDGDPSDPEQWAKANPSFPLRTSETAMRRLRKNLRSPDAWAREALGIWDVIKADRLFPTWDESRDLKSMPVERFSLGLEVAPDLSWASLSLAGRRDDGHWHVELTERRDGAAWLPTYVESLVAENPQIRSVVADYGSPAAALIDKRGERSYRLKGTRVRVTCPRVPELGQACSLMHDGIATGTVHHIETPTGGAIPFLSIAAEAATRRNLGDTGMWVYARRTATTDITPIQSATWALWGAQQEKTARPSGRPEKRKVVVM